MLRFASSSTTDPAVQSLVKNIVIAAEADEVIVRADFPQQMVIDMVRKAMAPPKKAESAAPEKPRTPVRRRTRRRA